MTKETKKTKEPSALSEPRVYESDLRPWVWLQPGWCVECREPATYGFGSPALCAEHGLERELLGVAP